jgi:fatty-acyl-CoA synthase
MNATNAWIRAITEIRASADLTLQTIIERVAATSPDNLALFDEQQSFTYAELSARMNRYSGWAQTYHLAGHTVGLLLPNCPDYVAVWLGLTRVGCTVALLNTNLPVSALRQCLATVNAVQVITDDAGADLFRDDNTIRVWLWPELEPMLLQQSPAPLNGLSLPEIDRVALYIYTSGTTGLPKATRITHRRTVDWSCWFAGMMDIAPEDRMYNCLPMYHSVGGITAIGSMLCKGGSVYVRQRFSVSRFWDEITARDCTIFQYIGELCRYLTLASQSAGERAHKLRLACGNGMQATVWPVFKERFGIPHILEFYAATEGALSLYNCEEKPGSIGRIPPFLAGSANVALIRCDPETGIPLRGLDGLCIRCGVDEAGEAITRLVDDRQFGGYTDTAATGQKILTQVFEPSDRWYRSGDLMRRDAAGFFYFIDRLGDTFRWKGENVATTEVTAVAQSCPGVVDAVAYGVKVPGEEGRVGMVALVAGSDFTLHQFVAHCQTHLPNYARPMFIRICRTLDLTGTFKLNKFQFVLDAYGSAGDPVWQVDQKTGAVALLTPGAGRNEALVPSADHRLDGDTEDLTGSADSLPE